MSDTKEFTKGIKRRVIKIGVIVQYGEEIASEIAKLIKCENTEQKLDSIKHILELHIDSEKKLFIIQKLLAYPKAIRISIANQIEKRIISGREANNENNN